MIDLLRVSEVRLKGRFNEIHKPTFEDLRQVHSDYLAIFTELKRMLQEGKKDPARAKEVMLEARTFLSMRRVPFEPVRDRLFVLLDILDTGKWAPELSQRERDFLQAAAQYAVTNQWALWAHHHGPTSATTTLLGAIDAAYRDQRHFNIQMLHATTTMICRDLRERWKEANLAYNHLRAETLSRITS